MRGYFGIGVEGISKPYNVGNLFRSAHAFGASFVFTAGAKYDREEGARIDTSDSLGHLPFYEFPDTASLLLPKGCQLVGVELVEDAIELPSFRHPINAAYVLGPEKGSISPAMVERCTYLIKIPAKFCLNVGIAGVVVMYDRLTSLGKFAPRPVRVGGPTEGLPQHVQGGVFFSGAETMAPFRAPPPLGEAALADRDGGE